MFGVLASILSPGMPLGRRLRSCSAACSSGSSCPRFGSTADRTTSFGDRGALPDVLTFCVSPSKPGLGFDAAIQKVAEKFKGPLGAEFQEYIKEVKLGRSRVESLRGLARRADLEEARSFVAALVQAEQLGVSLAHVLRASSTRCVTGAASEPRSGP